MEVLYRIKQEERGEGRGFKHLASRSSSLGRNSDSINFTSWLHPQYLKPEMNVQAHEYRDMSFHLYICYYTEPILDHISIYLFPKLPLNVKLTLTLRGPSVLHVQQNLRMPMHTRHHSNADCPPNSPRNLPLVDWSQASFSVMLDPPHGRHVFRND